ncbi:MAG: S1 family peptidase [Rickettsiales bacterium]|jgi:hypothetical protein|nr:S1 family peptidase [Rickettsiales bacterium]
MIFRKIFFPVLILGLAPLCASAQIDPREYADWKNDYPEILLMVDESGKPHCTAQYVAPNIILTAAHCVRPPFSTKEEIEKLLGASYRFCNANDTCINATLANVGDLHSDEDWALLRTENQSEKYFDVLSAAPDVGTGIDLLGFGNLRILKDEELQTLRRKYIRACGGEELEEFIIQEGAKRGLTPNAARDECTANSCITNMELLFCIEEFARLLELDDPELGPAMQPIFGDDGNLKVHRNCKVVSTGSAITEYNCMSYKGNSGGPFLKADSKMLGSIVSGGDSGLIYQQEKTLIKGTNSALFYKALQDMK